MVATATRPESVAPESPPLSRAPLSRSQRVTMLATASAGLGITLIVLDGWWPWAILRVLLVGALGSRLMMVVRRNGGRALVVVLVAGLVVTATGGAITVSYVSNGLSVRSISGLLAAGGGLVLVAIGAVGCVRAVHRWWRVLAVLAVFLSAYVVGSPVVLAVYATNVGRPELGRATPADRGLQYTDVTFPTTDGVTLSGWYIPSTNHAAVVLLHGATSTRSSVLEQAVVLARHGYGVLLFDARGMGRSGGRAMDFGWYGDRDIEAAVDFVENRPDVDRTRIAALGESMGGEEAIGALAIDSRVRAVVAEGATNRIASDQAWLSDAYGIRGRFQLGVAWLTYGLTDLLTEASPPISLRDAVRAGAPRPVLLIAAGTVADEEHAARDIQAAAPDSVDIWVVPGATHTGGLRAQPADWEQHVVAFLDANVTLPPDRAG